MYRLNKKLVMSGFCSRRKADEYIESGRVLVNGKIAVLGQMVKDTDEIRIDGKLVDLDNEKIILAYNKPKGVICTESKVEKNTKISDLIKDLGFEKRLFTVGRLDKDTTGLIILTNDGDLAEKITNTKNNYEKEYIVKVNKDIDSNFISNMSKGVFLKDLGVRTKNCIIKPNQNKKNIFNITITQGLNRQVRRMCMELGYRVLELKRVIILNLKLNNLKEGEYRRITKKEIGL